MVTAIADMGGCAGDERDEYIVHDKDKDAFLQNFKQKIEDLKKFVIKKPPKMGEDGKEVIDEKSAKAGDHLRWFIHYILTKRLGAQSVALQNIYVEMIRELNQAI